MKNLLLRRGVPFLLFLGFLSMASGGYLVYQIWGVPGLAGAASALSTPDEPPSLDGPPILPPVAPGEQAGAPAKAPEPPAPAREAAAGSDKPVAIPAPHEEALPEGTPDEPPAAPVPAPEAQKIAPKAPASAPKAPKNAPKAASVSAAPEVPLPPTPKIALKAAPQDKSPVVPQVMPVTKAVPVAQPAMTSAGTTKEAGKTAGKGRRGTRKVKADAVASEIPPEWNWFQRPLELQFVDGRIRIMADGSEAPVAVVEAAPARIEAVAPVDESALASVPADEEPDPAVQVAPQGPGPDREAAPFGVALGKMVRNRDRRSAAAEKAKVVLPSQGGSVGKVPPALIKLQKVIGDLALAAAPAATRTPASDEASRPATLHQVDRDSLAPSAADGALEDEPGRMEIETAVGSGRFGMGLREVLRESGWRAP